MPRSTACVSTRLRRSIWKTALPTASAAAVLVLAVVTGSHAQEASIDQQKCINGMNKRAAALGKAQGKTSSACVKDASAGSTAKLGGAGQDQTAAACLTNDVKGKVAKAAQAVVDEESNSCVADAPIYGCTGSAMVVNAIPGQSIALVTDLFGDDLDAVTVGFSYPDGDASKCQAEVIKRASGLVDALWKMARKGKKDALKGKGTTPVVDATTLQLETIGYLTTDAKSKASKAADKLQSKTVDRCSPTSAALSDLFPGRCSSAANATELGTCATTLARCRFCRSLTAADEFNNDCDDFDDGAANGTCATGLAVARQISDSADLITGPLAHGRIGDYLLDNGLVRFIVQDIAQRDMYSVGCFGGNIIDAEVVGRPGLDNFLEIQPAVNVETVINAQTLEIVNDGSDGEAAIIRTCGPDDLLDFVNPSTVVQQAGVPFPAGANDVDQNVEGCTEYILEPGASALRVETTIFNNDPTQIRPLVGDFINAAGEVELWGSGAAGIGEQLTANLGVLSYIGFGQAQGVDYSHVTVPFPGATLSSSFFSTSGVAYILQNNSIILALFGAPSPFIVPANGSNTFTRYFGVGDGSGANAIDLENLVKGTASGEVSGCVTVGGAPAPGARVSAGPTSGGITSLKSNWTADENGCYQGTLPQGSYGIAAWREGTPFEGGGASPLVHNIVIAAGAPVVQDFALPATGSLSVTVTDESGSAIPARVSVIGFDPSPEFVFTTGVLGPETTGLFRDQNDIVPFGVTALRYADASGSAVLDVEPGSYQLVVSRGTEYSIYEAPLTITAGATTNVAAQIAHVLDTSGFVSSDFHVHGINSADSRVSHRDRVFQFAGEGVDNIIMTDHHSHTDLTPTISALGFTPFVASTIGEEITTWDTGHYNAYPMTIDTSRVSGGSTDWGRAAAPGADFASLGAYILTPAEIDALATTGATATADTVVQINHIDSHFVPMKIDTSLVPPASGLTPSELLNYRMDPAAGNLFHLFKALEVWNSDSRGGQSNFLDERMGIWFNLLNQGLLTTAIADTDTHRFSNLESAGARTWTAASNDSPPSIDKGEVAQAVAAGRAIGGQGLFVNARLVANENASIVADLTLGGTTLISITDPVQGVDLEIDVQAPTWAQFDTIEIYANAATIASPTQPLVPQLFSATPTMVLTAGVDFTVNTTNVYPLIPGAERLDASVVVPFTNLPEDTWFVVVAKGTDGNSQPMFPVYPRSLATGSNTSLLDLLDGNLGESGTLALGMTNALYVDADGVAGFQAPLAP